MLLIRLDLGLNMCEVFLVGIYDVLGLYGESYGYFGVDM